MSNAMMSVPISKSISNCYSNVCIYLFNLIVQCACVCISSNIVLCECVCFMHTRCARVNVSFILDHVSDVLFCMFAHSPLVVNVSLSTHMNHHSVVLSGLALSSRLYPLTKVRVSRSLLPTSLLEHLSMGQDRNPPTQWTTSSAWSVLSWPWWPCCYRTCVVAERLDCRHRFALAARYGHSTSDCRTKRTVQNKLDFQIGDHCPFETVVLGECYSA